MDNKNCFHDAPQKPTFKEWQKTNCTSSLSRPVSSPDLPSCGKSKVCKKPEETAHSKMTDQFSITGYLQDCLSTKIEANPVAVNQKPATEDRKKTFPSPSLSRHSSSPDLGSNTKSKPCKTPQVVKRLLQMTEVSSTPEPPKLYYCPGRECLSSKSKEGHPSSANGSTKYHETNKENRTFLATDRPVQSAMKISNIYDLVTPKNVTVDIKTNSLAQMKVAIPKTEPPTTSKSDSNQKPFLHDPDSVRGNTLPPLLTKILEERRLPVRYDSKMAQDSESDDDSKTAQDSESDDDSTDIKVIHSYRPLQCHQNTEETTEPCSQTFEVRDISTSRGHSQQLAQPLKTEKDVSSSAVAHSLHQNQNLHRERPRQPLANISVHPKEHLQHPTPAVSNPQFVQPCIQPPKPASISQTPQPVVAFEHHGVKPDNKIFIPDRMQSCEKPQISVKNSSVPVLKSESSARAEAPEKTLCVNGKLFVVLSLLGSGGSSKVYQVFERETEQLFAVKIVNLAAADANMKTSYKNEISLLKRLQGSDQVIKMFSYEYREDLQKLLVILEKGDTDLASFLKTVTKKKSLHPVKIKSYWLEMVTAVADIHKAGIIHSDLKPANFLFVAGQLKLIDFGIASAVQADMTSVFKESAMGTSNYMAPEMFESTPTIDRSKRMYKVKQKSDVWSLGCILYNLVYGHTPFQHIHALVPKMHAIINPSYRIMFPEMGDPLLVDVLKACLTRDPKLRPSIEELLNHPYLTGGSAVAGSQSNRGGLDTIVAQLQTLTPNRLQKVSEVIEKLK